MKTFIEIGAGRGLGNAVARKFASEGYKVVLMSRSLENLKNYQNEFKEQGFDVDIQVVDALNPDSISESLKKLSKKYDDIQVVHYNVGVTEPDSHLNGNIQRMLQRYQVDVLGAYQVIDFFTNSSFVEKNGAILITGGGYALYPTSDYLTLSMDKAALRAMVLAEHDKWQSQGVFIGTVTVTNAIGFVQGYEPDTIAEKFYELTQNRSTAEIIY
ncbi:SDR family NAD(P)-dependent oxidoreductase [Streptococcus equinus]|uniref:SDR family NAD(P)-dependent oxidoreductase n=1 Tax=Streptococcus equinus TaxID=1335 RepID=UPI003BF83F1E